MIKSTTKKKVKKTSSKKANPGKDWIRHADLRPKGGGRNSDEHKYSDEKSNQEYYAKLHRLAEDIQWEKRDEYPIHGYPWHRALEDASEILAKKKTNPKCRTIKVRRKISMGKGKRPRILQVRRKVCNPEIDRNTILEKLKDLKNKKVEIFSGIPLSKSSVKTSSKLSFTGKLKTKNSETYYVESDDFNHIYDFYSKDVGMIKGNKIYLVYTF